MNAMAIVNNIKYNGLSPQAGWVAPDWEDFKQAYGWRKDLRWDDATTNQKMKVKSHYLVTIGTNTNPPADFGQLKLPVVDPYTGKLNKHALNNADAVLNGARGGVEGVGMVKSRLQTRINNLQSKF